MKQKFTFITALLFFFTFAKAQTYTVTSLIQNLSCPVAFDFTPDGRIFITQKGGVTGMAVDAQIKVFTATGSFIGIFYDLTDSTDADFERGLLGIAVDPDYVSNHFIYTYYVHKLNGDERIRIVRFTDNNNVGTNPRIIFDYDVPDNLPGNHFAGNLHFNPAEPNIIYFVIGDLGSDQYVDSLNYAHRLDLPYGKTLRINKDGTIPTDNPFYDDGNLLTGNCDIIWSYRHRNPFDFCFSPVNDSMYVAENGLDTWDEVNFIHKGREYGWARCEGYYLNSSTTQLCDDTNSVLPIFTWGDSLPSPTGILVYNDTTMPEFDNHLLVADYENGFIWDLTLGNPPYYDTVTHDTVWMSLTPPGSGLTDIHVGHEGCVYAMRGGYTFNGELWKICPSWMGTNDPNPPVLSLKQNAPNPFSISTTIAYSLRKNADVNISLYDISGKLVSVLTNDQQAQGEHSLEINAKKLGLAPGIYCCKFISGNVTQTVKVVVQ